jgi:hypothetical protein
VAVVAPAPTATAYRRAARSSVPRGAEKEKKMKATYIWQMINQVPWYFFFLIFKIFFMAFLCVSQQGEFKNTIKNFLGKSMSKTFGRKS